MGLNQAAGLQGMLKEGHTHIEGVDDAVVKNIEAAKALAKITCSSLGPNGLNKLVINHLSKIMVTSDCSTILREMEVIHPAAKMLVMAAEMQEQDKTAAIAPAKVSEIKVELGRVGEAKDIADSDLQTATKDQLKQSSDLQFNAEKKMGDAYGVVIKQIAVGCETSQILIVFSQTIAQHRRVLEDGCRIRRAPVRQTNAIEVVFACPLGAFLKTPGIVGAGVGEESYVHDRTPSLWPSLPRASTTVDLALSDTTRDRACVGPNNIE